MLFAFSIRLTPVLSPVFFCRNYKCNCFLLLKYPTVLHVHLIPLLIYDFKAVNIAVASLVQFVHTEVMFLDERAECKKLQQLEDDADT